MNWFGTVAEFRAHPDRTLPIHQRVCVVLDEFESAGIVVQDQVRWFSAAGRLAFATEHAHFEVLDWGGETKIRMNFRDWPSISDAVQIHRILETSNKKG